MKVWEAPNYLYLQDRVKEFKGKEVLVLDGDIYTGGRQGCFGGRFRGINVSSKLGILNGEELSYNGHSVLLPTAGHVSCDTYHNCWEFKEEPVDLGIFGIFVYMYKPLEEQFPKQFHPIANKSSHVLFGEDIKKYFSIDRRLREHLLLTKKGEEITKGLDSFVEAFGEKPDSEEYVSEYKQALDFLNANSQREFAFDDINV